MHIKNMIQQEKISVGGGILNPDTDLAGKRRFKTRTH